MNSALIEKPENLVEHLGESGEEEFFQLVSFLEDDPDAFALILVQSDFDTDTRDALMARLSHEISPVALQTISLSSTNYDLPVLLSQAEVAISNPSVIVVTGLEETPQIAFTAAEIPERPPALAILNHGREAIRQFSHPLIIWCDPVAYMALREHAPDFFDHYTGRFTFLDAMPAPSRTLAFPDEPEFDSNLMPEGRPRLMSAISPRPVSRAAVQFYEEQVQNLSEATPERARALLGLADALFASPKDASTPEQAERIENIVREALNIYEQSGLSAEWARAHALLANIIKRKLRFLAFDDPISHPEVQHHIEEALKVFTETSHPIEWAALQWLLGDYTREGGDEQALRRSIPHLQASQRVFTQQSERYFWASCEINLGDIYSRLPYTPRNFKRAVAHLESALHVYTSRDFPHEFGLVQMLLGRVYSWSAKQAKDKNEQGKLIRRAIACYEAAQRGFLRTQEWESVALNLSLAAMMWRELPIGNRRQHLRQSADCWLSAAENLERVNKSALIATHLDQAGETLLQLAQLTRKPDEFIEARQVFNAAQTAFARAGDTKHAHNADETVRQLDEFLSHLPKEQTMPQHITPLTGTSAFDLLDKSTRK
jgi:hypothetical protein